jgi:hypothetical protein
VAERPWALLAEFDSAERLLDAARAMRARGYKRLDAFTPYPLPELPNLLGWQDRKVPAAMLLGGAGGALFALAMQAATNIDFPLWVGGRPLIALPAFMLIAFELTVLGAILSGVVTFFVANRLPRLHHPIFDVPRFDLGQPDRFFLAVMAGERFDRDAVATALATLDPDAILDVGEDRK